MKAVIAWLASRSRPGIAVLALSAGLAGCGGGGAATTASSRQRTGGSTSTTPTNSGLGACERSFASFIQSAENQGAGWNMVFFANNPSSVVGHGANLQANDGTCTLTFTFPQGNYQLSTVTWSASNPTFQGIEQNPQPVASGPTPNVTIESEGRLVPLQG
jgi:hypothetical protein